MYRKPAFALLALSLACTAQVQAQEEDKNYDASVSLGYVATSGNTETSTFNTEFLLKFTHGRWTHNGKFQGLGSQENNTTRAERYLLENKSDFALDGDHYVYGKGSYLDDRFSGFDYQATASAGYGRWLIRNDALELEAFGGAGYRHNVLVTGDTEGEAIFTLGQNLGWQISQSARLTQSFITDIGDELTQSRFEVGLESNIISRIATKIAFQARNTSKVPAGNKKTDTLTSVSLVYSF
jgi:putative salt-induced outer membrane protein